MPSLEEIKSELDQFSVRLAQHQAEVATAADHLAAFDSYLSAARSQIEVDYEAFHSAFVRISEPQNTD